LLNGVQQLRKETPEQLRKYATLYSVIIAITAIGTVLGFLLHGTEDLRRFLWFAGLWAIGVTLLTGLVLLVLTGIAAWFGKERFKTWLNGWPARVWWTVGIGLIILSVGAIAVGWPTFNGETRALDETLQALYKPTLGFVPPKVKNIHLIWIASGGLAVGALVYAMGQVSTEEVPLIDPTLLPKELIIQDDGHQREEARRTGALKFVAFVVGVVLAYHLRIDALELLRGSLPNVAAVNASLFGTDLTVGVLLTGMAATAGSSFWHDKLDQLRSAKRQAESAAKSVQQVQEQVRSTIQGE
jgi:hypothetical protein